MVLHFFFFVCCLFFSKSVTGRELCEDNETFSFGFTTCSNCGGIDFCKKAKTRNPFCKRKYMDTATKVKKKGSEWCQKTCNPDCWTRSPTAAPTKLCADRQGLRFKHKKVWYTCNTLPSKKSKLKKLCNKKKMMKGGPLKGKKHVRVVCPETCGYVCPTPTPSPPPTLAAPSRAPARPPTHIDLVDTIPDAEGYALVYDLDPIPTQPDFSGGVAYTRAELDHPAFSRVAYFVELEGDDCGHRWAWVSVDAFTDNVALTGVPCPVCGQGALQQSLTNLNVVSNVPGLNGTSLAGNMEFWPFNYGPINSVGVPNASDDVYDSGDSPESNASGIGYGSMQIHAEDPSDPSNNPRNTVFAFNRFNRGQIADLGIGTRLTGNSDWTTAKNTDAYAVRRLRVYVQARGSAPPTVSPVSSPPATSSPVSSMTTVVTLGASGVDTVVPSGACPATVTKELVIDGSAYTDAVVAKAPVTLLLYRCASVGFDPMKIQLIGFQEGLWFEIVKVGTKVNLVVKSLTDYSEYFWGAGYSGDYPFQVAQGHYPDFHWDTVPKWISYRKKPNRADSKFTPDEIRSIANTNYMSWYGLVSVDEIVEVAAAIKVVNPDYKQLLYWNSFSYWGAPISTFNENWLKYKVVNGQRWYLTMENNKYVYLKDTTNKRRYYNHAIPAMRQWWIDHAVMMTSKSSIDGVFCDATRSNMDTDHSNMIEQLMDTLPEDIIKMGNFLRQRDSYRYDEDGKPVPHNGNRWRMPYADGSYLENVHDGPVNQPKGQSLIASMQLAREALWKGKIIFWNGAPYNCLDSCEVTEEEMAEYIKPTLAEYLILAEEYSYFNFAVTPVATDNPAWMWNTGAMEEFQRPLGRPLGPPVKVGNTFTRHFEHVAVMLTVGDDGVNKGTYVGAEWT